MATESTELVVATPVELLRIAVSQNADLDKLTKLMDLQERWEKNEARKAFVQAMADFKANPIVISKDQTNGQYQSKYVSIGNLVNTVTPILSKHGLSVRWDIDQSSGIKVSCIITHDMGHSESVAMIVPPDKSGAKNPIQEIKSAITYARACTFEAICGLASSDTANLDDDGNGSSNGELSEQIEWIQNAKDLAELEKLFKAAFVKFRGKQSAQKAIVAAKDARKGELQ